MVNKMTSTRATIVTANDQSIAAAADEIKRGGLVAFPTETVYGLGGDATNPDAIARIFATKTRPRFNPLIVHVSDLEQAEHLGMFNDVSRRLAQKFWPGALTMVLQKRDGSSICDLATAGLETIAIRVPNHKVAHRLLTSVNRPLAAPSANRSGSVSPTEADHVAHDFVDHPITIIDGGATSLGLESTVVAVNDDRVSLLRPGAIPRELIESVLGKPVEGTAQTTSPIQPHSPGQLKSHYAPRARVRLNATTIEHGEALLSFGRDVPKTAAPHIRLSETSDLHEAAANLFKALRALDAHGVETIAVMPIPNEGLGEAINDRLQRAAAPRP